MKMFILLAVFLTISSAAFAEWVGSQVGDTQYWENNTTGQSVSCSQVGDTTYCN